MSIKELSEKLGYKGANLYNKLDRDNFSEKELLILIVLSLFGFRGQMA